jgi:Respiratory-chain NADH dehydrogenase, 30 Kd subunit/Respiratory-chain NADH dehydrogenase, 49 Kd subunit
MSRLGLELSEVAAPGWRRACAEQVAAGGRFCGAHASGPGGRRRWTALFAVGAETRAVRTTTAAAPLPTLVDLIPAANWDEREAHDLYGIAFDGHAPLRPLAVHPEETGAWTVPVSGEGTYDVAVGPIHAGVIESGYFRFRVVGERILLVDPRLFHKHRGLEREAEGAAAQAGLPFAQRACGACAVANSVAYALACEAALGWSPPREVRRARTLLLELERLYNHLNDVAAICAGVGFAPGNMAFAALKERAQRLNREHTGHRFLFDSVAVGASRLALSAAASDRARGVLREIGEDAALAWRELCFAASAQARLGGVGELSREDAARLGAVGPVARASGLAIDARGASPELWYGSAFVRDRRPPRATSPRDWSCAAQSCSSPWRSSTSCWRSPSRRPPRLRARRASARRRRSEWPGWRALGARPSARWSWRVGGWRGCACAPAPTPIGRPWRTRAPATCCPTSP